MFDKIKQLMQLKGLQDAIKKEKFEAEKEGIKIVINGGFNVEEIILNPALGKEQQEKILKECFNEATKKVQASMLQKFSGLM